MSKKKKQNISMRQIIGAGLTLLFLLTFLGAAKWANYRQSFDMNKIRISGYEILEKADYQKIIDKFNIQSIHDADLGEIAESIETNPFVKAARVSRHYPNQLRINIVERQPLAILNLESLLMIDDEGVVLPDHAYSHSALIPILSGFNSAKDLYPEGEKTYSIKVKEAVNILTKISNGYPKLYENISELTLNKDDEYVLILADRPTRVILGKKDILLKLNILKNFDNALGQRQLTDYRLLDMRYKKQLVAREWT
ncbi:MAG: FtsQ-type POTRA domain-containing protein [Candidatus Marinimicrobia bacterium]|jgi:cell division protein FtsQ|nr:FtsQ-type POTRA domain-containing protein [Candidatus Neomarinimicrobiota bacterium]MBT3676097.1 FtsQ-type POTRA domain-containing protein [Candidatus Neomarinimicrobiota bacterium]MBT3764025.1 FtsQ-type POTRA domain-containing protein [Candidatus Neomarinimicrobiota bacterium]MBT4067754.1 FtsQ-type POTRA domain-containing protein [Candidatus Neomarinimicrobiota bacterium]MBT4270768.1 FtsQ-type POTRA domain-containing protein [Candidatus Neomarinimicrobiota bacterium]